MSTEENTRPVVEDSGGEGRAAGASSLPGSGQPATPPRIVVTPSASQDALVEAIKHASALGVPLLLAPGTYFTKPGRGQRIAIGANGLQIRLADPPAGTTQPAVIKRPDLSIDLHAPDAPAITGQSGAPASAP